MELRYLLSLLFHGGRIFVFYIALPNPSTKLGIPNLSQWLHLLYGVVQSVFRGSITEYIIMGGHPNLGGITVVWNFYARLLLAPQ